MKDVVIGCITNYTFEQIKLFVNSIDRSGFTGHKVMIVYNVPFSTVDELKKEVGLLLHSMKTWKIKDTHIEIIL